MSEYQYYEFQAVDRALTEREMAKLRSYSSRARISSSSFVNDYSWGAFKGDPDEWMLKYFDAFLYFANWGAHILKLRLPILVLDTKTVKPYCVGEHLAVREQQASLVLTFASNDEEEAGDECEGDGLLASMISVRAELMRGDKRALYLGWLGGLQGSELDDDDLEPPVPPGLQTLSAAQESLADFLRIDPALLRAAARSSPPLVDRRLKPAEARKWLAKMRVAEKDNLLVRMIMENDSTLAHELAQQAMRSKPTTQARKVQTRTVRTLLRQAERHGR